MKYAVIYQSETGNTRFPRSVFRGHPFFSRKAMISSGEKDDMALYRNRLFLGIF